MKLFAVRFILSIDERERSGVTDITRLVELYIVWKHKCIGPVVYNVVYDTSRTMIVMTRALATVAILSRLIER